MSDELDPNAINLYSEKSTRCPQKVYAEMHQKCPVARMSLTNSPVIARYEDVVWALRHPEIFSSAMEAEMALGTERPMIPQQVDPPAQTRYRKLLDPHFSRRKMEELAPPIRDHANQLIDAFIDAGECEFDEAFAIPLPCTAFLHLLGLPPADLGLFLELKDGIIRPQKTRPDMPLDEATEVRKQHGRQIYGYFERAID